MEGYEKRWVDGRLRLQWELIVEPTTRKALTLEHMMTVFRRTLRPEQMTREDFEGNELDSDKFFTDQTGMSSYTACQGQWLREGKTVDYYLDDATQNNPDGTITAGFLWWELEREDATVERWFRELVRAMAEAEDNLLLFGMIDNKLR